VAPAADLECEAVGFQEVRAVNSRQSAKLGEGSAAVGRCPVDPDLGEAAERMARLW